MNITYIHKAVSSLIKTTFSIPCYSRDTTETSTKPCFFIELNFNGLTQDNKRLDDYSMTIELTYVTTKRDDVTFYNIIEQVKELFKHRVKINVGTDDEPSYRYLQVTSFSHNYVGDNDEQLVFDIDINFKDFNELTEITTESMSEFNYTEEIL